MSLSLYTYSNLLDDCLEDFECSEDVYPLYLIKVFEPINLEDVKHVLYQIWQGNPLPNKAR